MQLGNHQPLNKCIPRAPLCHSPCQPPVCPATASSLCTLLSQLTVELEPLPCAVTRSCQICRACPTTASCVHKQAPLSCFSALQLSQSSSFCWCKQQSRLLAQTLPLGHKPSQFALNLHYSQRCMHAGLELLLALSLLTTALIPAIAS